MSGSVFEGSFIARRSGTAAQTQNVSALFSNHRLGLNSERPEGLTVQPDALFSKMWRLLTRRTHSLGRNTVICRWSLSCREQTFFPLTGLFHFRQRDVCRLREGELCVPRPVGSG